MSPKSTSIDAKIVVVYPPEQELMAFPFDDWERIRTMVDRAASIRYGWMGPAGIALAGAAIPILADSGMKMDATKLAYGLLCAVGGVAFLLASRNVQQFRAERLQDIVEEMERLRKRYSSEKTEDEPRMMVSHRGRTVDITREAKSVLRKGQSIFDPRMMPVIDGVTEQINMAIERQKKKAEHRKPPSD